MSLRRVPNATDSAGRLRSSRRVHVRDTPGNRPRPHDERTVVRGRPRYRPRSGSADRNPLLRVFEGQTVLQESASTCRNAREFLDRVAACRALLEAPLSVERASTNVRKVEGRPGGGAPRLSLGSTAGPRL